MAEPAKIVHDWIPAPAGSGSEQVCKRCGWRNDASAPKTCRPLLPRAKPIAHEYDPLGGDAA